MADRGTAPRNIPCALTTPPQDVSAIQLPDHVTFDWPFDFGQGDAFDFLGLDGRGQLLQVGPDAVSLAYQDEVVSGNVDIDDT